MPKDRRVNKSVEPMPITLRCLKHLQKFLPGEFLLVLIIVWLAVEAWRHFDPRFTPTYHGMELPWPMRIVFGLLFVGGAAGWWYQWWCDRHPDKTDFDA